ncbi:GAF domain-containing protein [Streptomyces lichenis]|uniref:GAF domain-containing protein n=1 Tax=Streptomyces lichenis TaxID=2306967 RepID=A0ABT0II67_9ACTN|nr:helix-turn-helix domain-containing protein [Streptomyces lichenis]MCK8681022.1 GAF domain-containing protein [Streptomyces lichenis]
MSSLAAMDAREAALLLKGVRDAELGGRAAPLAPRAEIRDSWRRLLRTGLDPDRDHRTGLLTAQELERRRTASPLRGLLPLLRQELGAAGGTGLRHIMVVADAEGRVLWREGHPAVLRMADGHGFAPGADWAEDTVGTNGVGTALVTGRPVQVHSAEHFVSTHHAWTCAGAPVTDPRDGRLLGAVDVSGPLATLHPATLMLVGSVARLAEAELRNRHFGALARLRAVAAPVLCRVGGRALAVDGHGWTAGLTGLAPVDRLALPPSFGAGRVRLAPLGLCEVEPLPGGWLVRVVEEDERTAAATRVVLDLGGPGRARVEVSGAAGGWAQELSPRHAELLHVLARHPGGRTAAELAGDVFGDPSRTVTVRAEMSRVRRTLGGLLDHRPYRFRAEVEVTVVPPRGRAPQPAAAAPSPAPGAPTPSPAHAPSAPAPVPSPARGPSPSPARLTR